MIYLLLLKLILDIHLLQEEKGVIILLLVLRGMHVVQVYAMIQIFLSHSSKDFGFLGRM